MSTDTLDQPTQAQPKPKTTIGWKVVVRFAAVLCMPAILFLLAGRIDWWQGWVYLVTTILLSVVSRLIVIRTSPDLIDERARYGQLEGVKSWDKRITPILILYGPLATLIVAALDQRFGWSPQFSIVLQLLAELVLILSYGLSMWAMASNRFFSAVVRIQTERGHTTVTTGPYRIVRHPGYAGGIVTLLAIPLLLGSLWAFIPIGLTVIVYILRTALEDRTLRAELDGYKDYAARVRYRLLPGVW
jgi:protein-S-isoprenylcysteine O-methyltransferase Ste14